MANSRKSNSVEHIQQQVGSFLDWNRTPELPLIVAFSGGLDSSVLLDAVAGYCREKAAQVVAVHFHHGLSPNADAWAKHCRDACQSYRIPIDVQYLCVPVDAGCGVEASARRARYTALNAYSACHVLLGHHATDQAETVLMNLFRGSGMLGLSGMQTVHGRYLRPLLNFERGALLAYAEKTQLCWIEDESNADHRYTRNHIRHSVLPVVQQRFPAVVGSLANSAQHSAQAQRLLEELAGIDSDGVPLLFPFPLSTIKALSCDRAANLVRALLTRSVIQCPPTARLNEFIRQLKTAGLDRHPELRLGKSRIHCREGYLLMEGTGALDRHGQQGKAKQRRPQ